MPRGEKILTIDTEAEASLLAAALEERGIPHFIKSYHDTAYDGLFQTQFGWGHVEGPAEYRSEIEQVYRDLTGREI
jgi:hypothetical protein